MVSNKFDLYDKLLANATIIGMESIPKKKHRVGLKATLESLSKRLKPGLAIRIIVPNCLPSGSLRRGWITACGGHDSHTIVEENDESTYIAYLWRDQNGK